MEYKIKLAREYDFPLRWKWEVYPNLGTHWDSFGYTITKIGAIGGAKRAIRRYENDKNAKEIVTTYTYGD